MTQVAEKETKNALPSIDIFLWIAGIVIDAKEEKQDGIFPFFLSNGQNGLKNILTDIFGPYTINEDQKTHLERRVNH